ncbi:hypothetical protein RMN56_28835 [Micromonospora halotolerans]|uniref:Lipoprotein n=1 Tax=Micromonospora halotolerans TaxID=709879 RepID=A0ABY9ZUV2_9ACTN|nr:hypothetical protein [Micromonospora halotolerans]WNM39091.1 hypothetical protein RMN56_28835 [Micromonospora halotolerans]
MRRVLVLAIVVGAFAGTAGCARSTTAVPTPALAPAGDAPADLREAEIYIPVLQRYLTTPTENSFPARTFTKIYVLDQAHPDAGDPLGKHERGTAIALNAQHQITAALAQVAPVEFIADRKAVIETRDGCPQVRDGGILITLGTVDGDDSKAKVAINGFVACLGATWLTYALQRDAGSGWRVTGTTGSTGIA